MIEVFEKIIEKLEELKKSELEREDLCDEEGCEDGEEIYEDGKSAGRYEQTVRIIEIVKQEAEKFGTDTNVGSNGWIPCSERLPEDDSICIVTVEYPNNKTMVDYGWFDRKNVCWFVGTQEFRTSNILAWQPLPEPYQPKGE